MHHKTPARWTFVVDVRCIAVGDLGAFCAMNSNLFDKRMHRAHHAVQHGGRRGSDRQATVGQYFLPGFLDGMQTHDTQAAWMHADDFFVIRPHLHQPVQVGTFKRVVKRELSFFGGGKNIGQGSIF